MLTNVSRQCIKLALRHAQVHIEFSRLADELRSLPDPPSPLPVVHSPSLPRIMWRMTFQAMSLA